MKNKRAAWATKTSAHSRLTDLALQLLGYSEVAKAAMVSLEKERRLPQSVGFRLTIESNMCNNILTYMMRLSPAEIDRLLVTIHKDSKRFEAEVKDLMESVSPDKKAKVLITPEEFKRESGGMMVQQDLIRKVSQR